MRIASRNNVALTRKTIQEKTCWEIIQFEFARQLLLLLVVRCSQVIRSDQSEETRREGFAFKKSKLLCTVKNKTRHSIYFTHHHKKRVSFEYLLYYQETGNHLTSSNLHFWWDILFVIKYFAVWRKFFFFTNTVLYSGTWKTFILFLLTVLAALQSEKKNLIMWVTGLHWFVWHTPLRLKTFKKYEK